MLARLLLVTAVGLASSITNHADGQNSRFLSGRRYAPAYYYPAPTTRRLQLSAEQMDRIYGPSILVRREAKKPNKNSRFVTQPR